MYALTATQARTQLFRLLERANKTHEAFQITSKTGAAVLLSQEDYDELIETLELLSTPGVLEGVREAKKDIKAGRTHSLKEVFGK